MKWLLLAILITGTTTAVGQQTATSQPSNVSATNVQSPASRSAGPLPSTPPASAQQLQSVFFAPGCTPAGGLPAGGVPTVDFSGDLPIADYLDAVIACSTGTPRMRLMGNARPAPVIPQNPWLQTEHELYQRVLTKQKVDVLVVPFQVQGYGLDRIERALMTADLSYAIANTGKYSVADPWLAARALGEGMRRLDPSAVRQLAQSIGARKVVSGYVGHDDHHTFTLTLQLEDISPTPPVGKKWKQDWRSVTFTDEQTPALKFHDMLPEVVGALPMELSLTRSAAQSTSSAKSNATAPSTPIKQSTLHLNVSPRDLMSSSKDSISPLAALDTLGALSAPADELSRERIFEHALLTAMNGPENAPAKTFLEAYAFFSLGRRPTALAVLRDDKSPRAETLRALLEGDLPSAERSFAKLPESVERLLLQISLLELEVTYDRKQSTEPPRIASVFGAATPLWQPLVQLRIHEINPWNEGDPALIKVMLDRTLPEPGLELESIEQGAAVSGVLADGSIAVDLANVRHIRRAAEHTAVSAFGNSQTPGHSSSLLPQPWDLLWLLESRSEGRIIKHVSMMIHLQGLPDSAVEELTHYAPLLSGYPALEAIRAEAAVQLAQNAPDDMRAGWVEQSAQSAAVAANWAPGQNRSSSSALMSMGIPSAASQFMADAYSHDYPRRAFWPQYFAGFADPQRRGAAGIEALTFSSWDISPLSLIPPGNQPGQAGAVLASLGRRFTGNPMKPEVTDSQPGALLTDPRAILAKLRKDIKDDPQRWDNYWALAQEILDSGGSYKDASRAYMSYPGFHDPHPEDSVALSNYAFTAGNTFYRMGLFELAKPFHKISADLDTGSQASMLSKTKLEILAVDYSHAVPDLLEIANRYSDPYSYQAYLSFLHAYGQHDVAWREFLQLDASFDLPVVWASALVGHRMQRVDDQTVRDWLHRPEIRDARFKTQQFAAHYAVLWSATDRMPPADLGKLVEELQGPPLGHISADGVNLMVPHPLDPKALMLVRPSPFRAGKLTKLPPESPIKSELAYFADAYAPLRAGDYDTAVTRFVAMADHYPIESYPLAYFAFAAAQTGDTQQLEKYLDTLEKRPSFDYWLARALFAGAHQNARAAQTALLMAARDRPSSDYRPVFTEYEYAQVCEWLHQQTHDTGFISNLLTWVKAVEVSQPTQAWSYALEYSYAPPGEARTRSLAMARYLDPLSKRIQSASESEIQAADAWFKTSNPFRPPPAVPKEAHLESYPDGTVSRIME